VDTLQVKQTAGGILHSTPVGYEQSRNNIFHRLFVAGLSSRLKFVHVS